MSEVRPDGLPVAGRQHRTPGAQAKGQWFAPYVGLPFGEGPGQVTCWGLVVRVYGDLMGVTLRPFTEVPVSDHRRVASEIEAGKDNGWVAVDDVRPFDVCLMRGPMGGRLIRHVGVMIDGGRMLHVTEESAACVVGTGHPSVSRRIAGFRRLAA